MNEIMSNEIPSFIGDYSDLIEFFPSQLRKELTEQIAGFRWDLLANDPVEATKKIIAIRANMISNFESIGLDSLLPYTVCYILQFELNAFLRTRKVRKPKFALRVNNIIPSV